MWKYRKEDEKPAAPAPPQAAPVVNSVVATKEVRPVETPKPVDNFRADVAHIGKSVLVKGELSGSEDLYLDGEVEGNIELRGHSLIIGPHGRVRANVNARDVVVHGKVDGNVHGTERVELKKSAILVGDIFTQRIVIEDGAYFKGAIDIQKDTAKHVKHEVKPEATSAVATVAAAAPVSSSGNGGSSTTSAQSSLLDTKKY